MSYSDILAFAVYVGLLLASVYALTIRVIKLSSTPRINHALVWDQVSSLFDAVKREGDPNNRNSWKPATYLANLKHPFLSSSALFNATNDKESQALYILIDEKPPFSPKYAEYVIGDGRLFFVDPHDQYFCFPWTISIFTLELLRHRLRILYLVYIDREAKNITTFPCRIKVKPYFEAIQQLGDQ
jgi:hypothetical protein